MTTRRKLWIIFLTEFDLGDSLKELLRSRMAAKYIFFEMLPSFILGILVFISILLLFQALRLTEFVLVHEGELSSVFKIMTYLSVSFLPVILPMSLLFSVLLTYGRLSGDSEIVALRSLGLSMKHLSAPAIVLSLITAILSAETSFYLAPWGNRQFELLVSDISKIKASVNIREGVFSEGFFNLVVYANKVDSAVGRLENVFIFDERNPSAPLTIIAKEGQLVTSKTQAGQSALLRLMDGNIHRTNEATYTKIDFKSYDINLFDAAQTGEKQKTYPSFSIDEIRTELAKTNLEPDKRIRFEIEFHRRWALAIACLIFGILAVGLGANANKRSGKSSGLVVSIVVVIAYWILYAFGESLAKKGQIPVWNAIWLANFIFLLFTVYIYRFRRA
jgi:lipopolysaccharide export system permease protein